MPHLRHAQTVNHSHFRRQFPYTTQQRLFPYTESEINCNFVTTRNAQVKNHFAHEKVYSTEKSLFSVSLLVKTQGLSQLLFPGEGQKKMIILGEKKTIIVHDKRKVVSRCSLVCSISHPTLSLSLSLSALSLCQITTKPSKKASTILMYS